MDDNLEDGCLYSTENGIKKQWKHGDYLRKIEGMELMYDATRKFKSDNTIQAIWMKSEGEITEDSVETAIRQLMKKCPLFHICLGKRGGHTWMRLMDSSKLNFESLTGDPLEVFQSLIQYQYDFFNGPLWKITLVYPTPSLKEAVLIFNVHHMITDAKTNTLLQNDIVQTLNANAVGEIPKLRMISLNSYVINYKRFPIHKYGKFLAKSTLQRVQLLWTHRFPRMSHVFKQLAKRDLCEAMTRVRSGALSVAETQTLFAACKRNNATVNACVSTACCYALVQIAEEKSPSGCVDHDIVLCHAVDIRRFYEHGNADLLGCHTSIMMTDCKVPSDVSSHFWEATKLVNASTKKQIEKKDPCKVCACFKSYVRAFFVNDLALMAKKAPITDQHIMSTNMGNLDKLFTPEQADDHVKITDILRSTNREYGNSLFHLTFHTFKNQLLVSIDSFSTKMSDQDSDRLFEAIMSCLRTLPLQ